MICDQPKRLLDEWWSSRIVAFDVVLLDSRVCMGVLWRPLHHHVRLAFDMVVLFLGLGYLDLWHIFTLQADVHICSNM